MDMYDTQNKLSKLKQMVAEKKYLCKARLKNVTNTTPYILNFGIHCQCRTVGRVKPLMCMLESEQHFLFVAFLVESVFQGNLQLLLAPVLPIYKK